MKHTTINQVLTNLVDEEEGAESRLYAILREVYKKNTKPESVPVLKALQCFLQPTKLPEEERAPDEKRQRAFMQMVLDEGLIGLSFKPEFVAETFIIPLLNLPQTESEPPSKKAGFDGSDAKGDECDRPTSIENHDLQALTQAVVDATPDGDEKPKSEPRASTQPPPKSGSGAASVEVPPPPPPPQGKVDTTPPTKRRAVPGDDSITTVNPAIAWVGVGLFLTAGIAVVLGRDLAPDLPTNTEAVTHMKSLPAEEIHAANDAQASAMDSDPEPPPPSSNDGEKEDSDKTEEKAAPATTVVAHGKKSSALFSKYRAEILSPEEEAAIEELGLGVSGEELDAAERKLRLGKWPTGDAGRVVMATILRKQFPRIWVATGRNPLTMSDAELHTEFLRMKESRYYGHLLTDLPDPTERSTADAGTP